MGLRNWFKKGREYRVRGVERNWDIFGQASNGYEFVVETRNRRVWQNSWQFKSYAKSQAEGEALIAGYTGQTVKKPSDKWEGRVVAVDPPYKGECSGKEYPFLAQVRIKGVPPSKWTDLEHHETAEAAETAIIRFKKKMDFEPEVTVIKYVD